MAIMRFFLLLGWLTMLVVSWRAVSDLGYNWPQVFFGDIAQHTWRAQFNIDFLIHLLLFAAWVIWRETSRLTGIVCGFFCIFLGGLFGFPYLLATTYRSGSDTRRFLLGKHA